MIIQKCRMNTDYVARKKEKEIDHLHVVISDKSLTGGPRDPRGRGKRVSLYSSRKLYRSSFGKRM